MKRTKKQEKFKKVWGFPEVRGTQRKQRNEGMGGDSVKRAQNDP